MAIEIRRERSGDEATIYRVTEAAFQEQPYAGGDEQDLVNCLRKLGQGTHDRRDSTYYHVSDDTNPETQFCLIFEATAEVVFLDKSCIG